MSDTATPPTQSAPSSIPDDAKQLGQDVGQAVEDAEANVAPVIDDAHRMLDDIKGATNQSQVHEIAEKLRAWIKANL